jgi:ACS family glucarate transporter-like MFS transporter
MRALGNGFVTMGGRGGAALAPLLTAQLILFYAGEWRPVFWLYGVLGVLWAVAFVIRFRDTPQESPSCNAAEVAMIVEGRVPEVCAARGRSVSIPWALALGSVGLWLQCLLQFAGNISWTFLGTWLPTYLQDTYRLDLATTGYLSSLPFVAGMCGCLLGGLVADRLTRRFGLRWGRSALAIASKFLAALFMLLSAWAGDAVLATVALTLASFVNDLGLSVTWAYLQDAGGRYVAPLLGFANMFGNFGAMVSPPLLNALRDRFGWAAALYACSFFFVVAGACWFGMDARVPIVPEKAA